jgi:trans-2,3-dihydro-3-hydroxyanthranilate isomerase
MPVEYHTLDVFTARVFSGNPLAVVPDAAGLDDETMMAITREFNYSETVFVLPPTAPGADYRLRIFTPARELPFAGHPTVGTAVLLSELGLVTGDGLVLQEGVGNVMVSLSRRDGVSFAELTVPGKPEFRPETPAPEVVADLVGLARGDLDMSPGSLATASCGVPFLLVRIKDKTALARAKGNELVWRTHLADAWAKEIYAYCADSEGAIRARMFAPGMGIAEDPATGAAAAALAAHLGGKEPSRDGSEHRTIIQGVEMGRPSRLEIGWTRENGMLRAVTVGGHAVQVARGSMTCPTNSPTN